MPSLFADFNALLMFFRCFIGGSRYSDHFVGMINQIRFPVDLSTAITVAGPYSPMINKLPVILGVAMATVTFMFLTNLVSYIPVNFCKSCSHSTKLRRALHSKKELKHHGVCYAHLHRSSLL
ncbi:hypothetical protein SUGI_0203910 [Cryptomeria japonica]|nr:hypothetical protein SUGI_0203910 [Cryptomeria japonica]